MITIPFSSRNLAFRQLLMAILIIGVCMDSPSFAQEKAKFEVFVTAPPNTPSTATLSLTGNIPALGSWSESGLKLDRQPDGKWRGSFLETPGKIIECKITRGTWKTVEKGENHTELPNRKIVLEKGMPIDLKVSFWADELTEKPTFTGDIRLHADFKSQILGNGRDILVYLPPGYKSEGKERFPVLYMHDGQNTFNSKTSFGGVEWSLDETAESLIKSGKIQPLIIVAIGNNGDRMNEYTPVYSEKDKIGGKGEMYIRFIIEELKPFIDSNYRTLTDRMNTGIGGSSLGALISIYAIARNPEVFSRCAALSVSIWWADRWILTYLKEKAQKLGNSKFWMDMGTREGDDPEEMKHHLQNLRDAHEILLKDCNIPAKDFGYAEVEGAMHNEASWAARSGRVLQFLFPVKDAPQPK